MNVNKMQNAEHTRNILTDILYYIYCMLQNINKINGETLKGVNKQSYLYYSYLVFRIFLTLKIKESNICILMRNHNKSLSLSLSLHIVHKNIMEQNLIFI